VKTGKIVADILLGVWGRGGGNIRIKISEKSHGLSLYTIFCPAKY